jgi:hypothetical protein
VSCASVAIGLGNPAVERRRARTELLGEFFGATPGVYQLNELLPKFRYIGRSVFGHDPHLLLDRIDRVHESGSSPPPPHGERQTDQPAPTIIHTKERQTWPNKHRQSPGRPAKLLDAI